MVALFVVLTFLLFILVDFLVLKAQGKKHPAFSTFKVFDKRFIFPEEIYFAKGHTWLRLLKDGLVRIGIDEFILKSFSNLKLNVLVNEGSPVKKGGLLFEGKIGDKKLNFFSPVDGTVKILNKNLNGNIYNNPYQDNWGVTIMPERMADEMSKLKSKTSAVKWLSDEFSRLKDFLSFHTQDAALGLTMHDGGNIVEGVLSNFNESALKDFEEKFLKY